MYQQNLDTTMIRPTVRMDVDQATTAHRAAPSGPPQVVPRQDMSRRAPATPIAHTSPPDQWAAWGVTNQDATKAPRLTPLAYTTPPDQRIIARQADQNATLSADQRLDAGAANQNATPPRQPAPAYARPPDPRWAAEAGDHRSPALTPLAYVAPRSLAGAGDQAAPELELDVAPAADAPVDVAPADKGAKKAKKPAQPSFWRDLLALLVKITVLAVGIVLVFSTVYGVSRNADADMNPMVKDGDLVLFYRLEKSYAAGDLAVLQFQGQSQVRRVIAIAGDTVDISDAGLLINGALVQEPDIYQDTRRYDTAVVFPLTVGAGQVFVLGDARDNATDSRTYGAVDEKDTLGTVITILRRRGF